MLLLLLSLNIEKCTLHWLSANVRTVEDLKITILATFFKVTLSYSNVHNFAYNLAQLLQLWYQIKTNILVKYLSIKWNYVYGVLCWVKTFSSDFGLLLWGLLIIKVQTLHSTFYWATPFKLHTPPVEDFGKVAYIGSVNS